MSEKCKEANSRVGCYQVTYHKISETGQGTIITSTILPAEHSGKPSYHGYSGNSNQLTEIYLVEMQNPRLYPRPPESESTV